MEELKKKVLEWTGGLPIEGKTKEELKALDTENKILK